MTQSWTLTVEEDPETGDAILKFPEDLLQAAGWQEGDVLTWETSTDDAWVLRKQLTP
jgi:hypothetical protein